MNNSQNQFAGLILAGGQGSRMGFVDKPLLELGGKTIIQWIFAVSEKHLDSFLISLNHNHSKYHVFGCPIIEDVHGFDKGPLIGIYSAMDFLSKKETRNKPIYLITLPGDVPFFPEKLLPNLMSEMLQKPRDVVMAKCEERLQPLFAVWALSAKDKIKKNIQDGFFGPRQILSKLDHKIMPFETQSVLEFLNINTKHDFKIAQKLLNNT